MESLHPDGRNSKKSTTAKPSKAELIAPPAMKRRVKSEWNVPWPQRFAKKNARESLKRWL
jgi:hypothetical protein